MGCKSSKERGAPRRAAATGGAPPEDGVLKEHSAASTGRWPTRQTQRTGRYDRKVAAAAVEADESPQARNPRQIRRKSTGNAKENAAALATAEPAGDEAPAGPPRSGKRRGSSVTRASILAKANAADDHMLGRPSPLSESKLQSSAPTPLTTPGGGSRKVSISPGGSAFPDVPHGEVMRARAAFRARRHDELSLAVGDRVVFVRKHTEAGWYVMKRGNIRGLVPAGFVVAAARSQVSGSPCTTRSTPSSPLSFASFAFPPRGDPRDPLVSLQRPSSTDDFMLPDESIMEASFQSMAKSVSFADHVDVAVVGQEDSAFYGDPSAPTAAGTPAPQGVLV